MLTKARMLDVIQLSQITAKINIFLLWDRIRPEITTYHICAADNYRVQPIILLKKTLPNFYLLFIFKLDANCLAFT